MWAAFVEFIQAAIFAGSQVLGGSIGASILVISALVRLALLPLALRAAREGRRQQATLALLKPQLDRLRARYKDDPRRLFAESRALQERHGVALLPKGSFAATLAQAPLLGGLFAAVRNGLGLRERFLWIADLGRGDLLLVLICAAMTAAASALAPVLPGSAMSPKAMATLGAAMTLLFLFHASSAIALSVGAGSAVSVLQGWLVRREVARERLSPTAG